MAGIIVDKAGSEGPGTPPPPPPTGEEIFIFMFCLMATDKGGEGTAGHSHPSAASVGGTGRVSEAAGQRIREGDQAEGARGQRGETGGSPLISPPQHPPFKNSCGFFDSAYSPTS